MDNTMKVGVPVWLVGILMAFAVSSELGWAALIGYASQWSLKAPKGIPDWVAPSATVVGCLAVWTFALGHIPKAWPPPQSWTKDAIEWALSALGVGTAAGHTAGAPRTNSL